MKRGLSERLKLEKENPSVVICSIDKDLRGVPGYHYNWNKEDGITWVSEEEATYNFYKQLLTGDRTDNIQGIKGIGPKKAEKILAECDSELSMYHAVRIAYTDYELSLLDEISENPCVNIEQSVEGDRKLLENAYLLWMVRELDSEGKPVMWRPPE